MRKHGHGGKKFLKEPPVCNWGRTSISSLQNLARTSAFRQELTCASCVSKRIFKELLGSPHSGNRRNVWKMKGNHKELKENYSDTNPQLCLVFKEARIGDLAYTYHPPTAGMHMALIRLQSISFSNKDFHPHDQPTPDRLATGHYRREKDHTTSWHKNSPNSN